MAWSFTVRLLAWVFHDSELCASSLAQDFSSFSFFFFPPSPCLEVFLVSTCELFSSWMFSPAALLEFFPSKDNKCGFLHLMFFCHALELVLSFCVVTCCCGISF